VDPLEPEVDVVKDATLESFFFVFLLSHFGQGGILSASEKRSITSNTSPHFAH
jgi:hypothetical protein